WQSREKIAVFSAKKLSAAIAAALIIPITISLVQYNSYQEHINPSEVVVVQPNIDPYGKIGFIPASEKLTRLLELSAGVAKPCTEFFIWPETALSSDRGGIDEEQFRAHPAYERVTDFLDDYKNGN